MQPRKAKRSPPKSAWKPGQSGNPAGKKPGTRNRATLLAQAMLEDEVQAVVQVVVAAARAGDLTAAKMVIERVVPPMRERPIAVNLPADLKTADAVSQAAAAILQATCNGELLPAEAQALAGIVEMRRRTIETQEIEERLAALEKERR